MYEVIVGNIGTVYHGGDVEEATALYMEYAEQSELATGRASGEDVILIGDNEIILEYIGRLSAQADCIPEYCSAMTCRGCTCIKEDIL
jgi:hypothetical protein